MAQELDKNGLIASWQSYYKNVHKGANHSYPTFYIVLSKETTLNPRLYEENLMARFIFDTYQIGKYMAGLSSNTTFLDWNSLTDKDKVELWRNVDYIVCDNSDPQLLPALLSGVEHINKIDRTLIENFSSRDHANARVSAFEQGKTLFDFCSKL